MADVNHDLLLAVLALRAGAASGDALRSLFMEWSRNPDRPVAALLREQGILDEGHLVALERLVSAHLHDHNGDIRASLDACNAHALTQDLLTEIASIAPGATLGGSVTQAAAPTIGDPHGVDPKPGERRDAPSFGSEDRFERIRPHAKGGIGQVWMARDRELQRVVALKEIQPQYAERDDHRVRFLLEAEITGSLEHPGIVPVYSLGRGTDGRPYYAMRFIHGESLSVAIKHFHRHRLAAPTSKASRRGHSTWGVEFQQLLRRFLDVCDAMEYAHSRGVIHRDLKPGNIMLGPFGETLVVDWGIAKVIGKHQAAPGGEGPKEADVLDPELTTSSTATSGETQPGTTIGTPSYMSPEQARGSLEEIGPASDVYSLGATLYELLTGTAPYQGEQALKIIAMIKEGQLTPPRALLATIPPSLEAICLKAMALQPEKRYDSARELALDLEHWLADEPVSAYAETRIQKLSRWLRRHRAWTQAGTAALVGITFVATLAVVFVERARLREQAVRIEAQANFALAQKAVDEYLTNVSEDTLLKEQNSVDIRKLRQKLLQTALRYYNTFVQQRGDDPELRKDLAGAYFRVAVITEEISSQRDALIAFNTATRLWEKLLEESPEDADNRYGLARCLVAAGRLQISDSPREATRALERAMTLLQSSSNEEPSNRDYQSSLAESYRYMGSILASGRQSGRAIECLDTARRIQQRLVDLNPAESIYVGRLAEILNVIGRVHVDYLQDFPAGLKTYEEVKKICLSLLERLDPKPVIYQDLLAVSNFNIGVCLYNSGRARDSIAPYEQAIAIWTELVKLHASVISYQETLGKSLRELAQALAKTADRSQAIARFEQSARLFERLSHDQPEVASFHYQLAYTWNCLGYFYDEDKDNQLAISPFLKAVAEQRLAVEKAKDVDSYREELALYLENLGEQYVDLDLPDKSFPHYEEALQIHRDLRAAHPDDLEYAITPAARLSSFAQIERRTGQSAAASRHAKEAREVLQLWRQSRNSSDLSLTIKLAGALLLEADTLADQQRSEPALGLIIQATDLLKSQLQHPSPASALAPLQRLYSELLWEKARVEGILNRPENEIAQAKAEQRTLWTGRPASELVDLAREEAIRAGVIAYGKPPRTIPAQAVRRLDKQLIGAHLQLAVSQGLRDTAALQADPVLRSIYSPGELKDLLKR